MQAVPEQSVVELPADLRQPPAPRLRPRATPIRRSRRRRRAATPGRRAAACRAAISISCASSISISTASTTAILNPLVADRAGRPERRTVGRDGVRRERAAARRLDRQRAAAEGVGRGALRGRRGLGRRDPQARRQQGLRAGVHAEPHRRGARAASATGRSTRPPSRPDCRSASMPSAMAAGR